MKEIRKRSECPISYCLDFFGDKWALLIIRDIVLNDKYTFGDFLSSDESIATNILTDRLKMLEAEGFIVKYPVPGKARVGYCLTEEGISLISVVIEMALWGASKNVNGYRKELGAELKKDKSKVIKQLATKFTKKYRRVKNNLEQLDEKSKK
ncbi:MAG: helix-turn-helix transcriptional regulator [Sphingobacteriia bacterium]|nr:helix-turn-helix transcriptional regulator [Sphingobacteriia bacterium]